MSFWGLCRIGFGAPVAAQWSHPLAQTWCCLWKLWMQMSQLKNEADCWMLLEWSVHSLPIFPSPHSHVPMLDSSALNWSCEGKHWRLDSISSEFSTLSKKKREAGNPPGLVGKGKRCVCWEGGGVNEITFRAERWSINRGLLVYFIYSGVYLLTQSPNLSLPLLSPWVTLSLFSTFVSLLLFCK